MVQLLFARLPQFKDDTTLISSTTRVKDLSTRKITTNNHQRVNSESLINEQQINRKNYSILLVFLSFFYRNNFINNRNKFNLRKFSGLF